MAKRLISFLILLGLILNMGVVSVFSADTPVLSYDFEVDDEGWVYWNNISGARKNYPVKEAYVTGSRSLFINDNTRINGEGMQSPYFNAVVGETYTVLSSAFVITGKITMYLRFYDKDKKQISSKSATFNNPKWEEKAVTLTAPENAVYGRFLICTTTTDVSGAYVDNVKLFKGTYTASSSISGVVPAVLPEIKEDDGNFEIVDDGYSDGELIYFQSFEDGMGEWTPYYNKTSYSLEAKNATHGTQALHVKDTSETISGGPKSGKIAIGQGNQYTIYLDTFNIKEGVSLYLRFYDSEAQIISQATLNFPALGWRYGRMSAKAPEYSTHFDIMLVSGTTTTAEAYFDNIRIYKGNYIAKPEETEYAFPVQSASVNANIIAPVNNKLQYNTYNDKGDTLSDFSHAGFYEGKINLPDTEKLPVAAVLSPSGTNDDTAMIQAAIDSVEISEKNPGMKVVKLKAGTYYINDTGLILKSGVLISGEGQGPNGTVLHSMSKLTGSVITGEGGYVQRIGNNVNITDSYVKAGSKSITVEDASSFNVGDLIYIIHPSTPEWIDALKMNNVNTVYGSALSWQAGTLDNRTSRVITKIEGNKIFFDYGLFIPYDKTYAQSYIFKADDSPLIHDVGVENLRVTSEFNGDPYDNNHAKTAVYVKRVKNMFVRNVTTKNLFNGVFGCRADSSNITIQNCSALDPVSTIEGGNRYPFYADVDTERILFTGCYSYDGRHDYMAVKGTAGPIVFSDSISDMSNACSETHAGFATGVLYENLYQITDRSAGYIGFPNRGYYGTDTPQGWTAAGCVAWNCLSHAIIANKPLLSYNNFLVGVWGIYDTETSAQIKQGHLDGYKNTGYRYEGVDVGPDSAFATNEGTPMVGDIYKEAEFTPVNPRSLFKAQLSERLTGTIKNAKPNAPVIVYPRPDKEVLKTDNQVSVNGMYEKGASKVYVYIDDVKYEATLDSSKFEFDTTVALTEGVHKIYATQVIDGLEGNKSADRFIIVGDKGTENPDYLQSNYSEDTLSFIANDGRITYDEYLVELKYPSISDFEGEGTDESPYIIDSQLKFEAVFKNSLRTHPKDKTYLLTGFDEAPLKLSDDFKPIGEAFRGKLIGGDMVDGSIVEKIQIIEINTTTGKATVGADFITSTNSNKVQGAIFHKLEGATIKNLKLTGSVTTANTPAFLGVLAGHSLGSTIENVHNYASITGDQAKGIGGLIGWTGSSTVITNCSNHGDITVPEGTTDRPDVGGIVGNMTSTTITKTYNYGNIQGRDNAGGIAGYSNCNISQCGNYGNITVTRSTKTGYAGGISGRLNGGNVSQCFNAGNITSVKHSGGISGALQSGKTSAISDCFNVGIISGKTSSGLVIGENLGTLSVSAFYDIANPSVKAVAGAQSGTVTITDSFGISAVMGPANIGEVEYASPEFLKKLTTEKAAFANQDIWVMGGGYAYPNLKNCPYESGESVLLGEGTEENPYRIYLKEDLVWINEYPSAHFIQLADIEDVSTMLCTEAPFTGVYDGNNFSITIDINDEENEEEPKYAGLFKYASGTIKNVIVNGSLNAGYVDSQGGAGALIGKAENGLTVTNCKNYASVTSTGHQTAGIIGSNASGTITVTECINYGDVLGIKASGIIGVISASSTLQKCGNYGNITGGTRAAGISTWVYTWKWLENNFNVGTITATSANGIAAGLYTDLITKSNAKNIQKSFNAGNLIAKNTYGIANIADDGTKAVKIQHLYNAVYADYPIINATEANIPVSASCYYLANAEADSLEGTAYLSRDDLKKKAISGLSVMGNYEYPQVTLNPLDEDMDAIEFYNVTLTDNTENSSVETEAYKKSDFYVRKNGVVSLNVTPNPHFYTASIYLNGELLEDGISAKKAYNVEITEDTEISVSDKLASFEAPSALPGRAKTITSDNSGENITVNGTEYSSYAIIAAKAPVVSGLKLKEFGIYTSVFEDMDKDNYQHKFTADSKKISATGAFGILLYNSSRNDLKAGKTYYVMPYGIYEDVNGNTYHVTGSKENFTFR